MTMERKIGEIFEFGGEWYQTVKSQGKCCSCDFMVDGHCIVDFSSNGSCFYCHRKDKENVIFKKLEKAGEPYMTGNKLIQRYKIYPTTCCINVYGWYYQNLDVKSWTIDIEIKQNKEDMEKYKMHDAKEDIPEFDKVVDECLFGKEKPNLKPFNLEQAKLGKPICTRDGRKARIICFDRITCDDYSKIVACVTTYDGKDEYVLTYGIDGYIVNSQHPKDEDLMMLPEKKEGWVNVYKERCYETREEAIRHIAPGTKYVDTIRVEWEE